MKNKKQSKNRFSPVRIDREIEPILGVYVSSKDKQEVLTEAYRLIEASGGASSQARNELKIIVTPNPEIVYRASADPDYRNVLNKADLSLTDGIGLVWARKFLKIPNPERLPSVLLAFEALSCGWDAWVNGRSEVVPGRIIFEELVETAAKRGWRVFLLGGGKGVAEETKQKLLSRNPKLQIESEAGPWLNIKGEPRDEEQAQIEKETIKRIDKFNPHLLFVAFGPPKQELWLDRNKSKLKAKVAMVVGGAFDYVSQKVPTPPSFISDLGLEWAWRLVTQPERAPRIYTALVKFPLKVFQEKLIH